MALYKAISASSLAFLPPRRESFMYNERVYCPRILSSFPELAARTSELHGHVVAATGNPSNFTKSCNNQVIQAVLQSEREVEVSGSILNGGFHGKFNNAILANSGGLDTSVIVLWLRENYGCDVVCFTVDVGQGIKELEVLEKKAKASRACQLVVKDLREEFV
ncbi:argininosuccinate synthase, chloroplastic-like [Juglans microcarpa x Juglans regia]|uniref:argininosuccinate synthase, chloroplastic-like n=1 Tax=Juglans microcarpa x Juglans regia TaxID=2249226 RepID=UPI001B7F3944|nr:argininosuccinate synthase, chloroplastic-like [Juglans microcarpa x Juglans regia]